jgi:thymidine kinase
MAKLYFRYGVMNSGKSLFLLSTAHNFKDRGVDYLIMKPSIDTRDPYIKSRAINDSVSCTIIDPTTNVYNYVLYSNRNKCKWILVDEAQFLTVEQVDQLAEIVDKLQINVICYGLRTDFQTNLFPGSKRLFEVADSFEEMKSTCACGNKATINARIDVETGEIITEGEQIDCGAEDKYVTLCRKCYNRLRTR